MSQIKLKHSGGNSVIIAAPDSNPASDRTLKLPSNADGTVLTTTNPKSGNIIQVVNMVKTDTVSLTMTTSFQDVSGFTISITPTAANSKIILAGSIVVASRTNYAFGKFLRSINGGTYASPTGWRGDAAGNRSQSQLGSIYRSFSGGDSYVSSPMAVYAVDTDHNTTNSITYKLEYKTSSGSSSVIYFNRSSADANDSNGGRSCSHLTLMEVAA